MDEPLILGIETSCDETAAAVASGRSLLSNVVASQVGIHARYGGVVPEVASRQHLMAILPTVDKALAEAAASPEDLQAIAVTYGPGLAGSLLVGVNAAKGLALAWGLPLIGINHLEAHIYANWTQTALEPSSSRAIGGQRSEDQIQESEVRMQGSEGGAVVPISSLQPPASEFPLLCLIVSGGHTDLVFMERHLEYRILGRTRDDAAGEAFDKAARLLGLGYPGGPAIQEAAKQGDSRRLKLPRAWLKGSNDFSFSGLKTALWRLVDGGALSRNPEEGKPTVYDAAAAFQEAVVEVLVTKAIAVARRCGAQRLLLAGGVAANASLRNRLREGPIPVSIPPLSLCTDNAGMVAACGCYCWQAGRFSGYDLDVVPGLPLAGNTKS